MAKTRQSKAHPMISMERSPERQIEMLKMENSILNDAYFQLRKSKADLERSEKKYQTLVESANELVLIIQGNRIQYANKKTIETLGYPLAEIKRRPLDAFIYPEDRVSAAESYKQWFAGSSTLDHSEFRIVDRQGNIRWVLARPTVIEWEGKPASLNLLTDVTESKTAEKEVRSSEAKFRTIFNGGADGILIADVRTMKFFMANSAICRFLGYSEKELLKMGVQDIHTKEALRDNVEKFKKLAKKQIRVAENVPCLRKDGSVAYADVANALMEIGGVPYNVGFFRDVTERRKFEESLKASESKFRAVVEHITDVVFSTDLSGNITFITPNVSALGYALKDVIGHPFADFIHPEDRRRMTTEFKSSIRHHLKSPTEFRLMRKDGTHVLVEEVDDIIVENGKPLSLVGTFRDITDRKKSEEALRASEERFRQISESAEEFIWEVDSKGLYTYASAVSGKILGYSPREMVGKKHFYDFFAPGTKKEFKKAALKAFANKEPIRKFVNTNIHKSGKEIILETSGMPILDSEGKLLGYRGADIDITDRKRAENLLHESESRYRLLFSSMQSGFALHEIVCDKTGKPIDYRFLEVNPAFEAMTGLNSSKIVGKTVRNVLPGTEASWIKAYGKVALSGKSAHFENYSSELKRYYEVLAYSPKKGTFATLITDITERKKSEDALRTSEEKFRVLTESASDQIFMVDRHYIYLSVNKTLADQFRMPIEKMVGKPLTNFFHRKIANQLIKNCDFVFKTGHPKSNFEEIIEIPGRQIYINTSLNPIRDSKGQVIAVAGIARDITEQKAEQEQLLKLKLGFERSTQIMFMTDLTGKIQYVNPAFEKIYGYKEKEVIGKTPRILKSGKQSAPFYRNFWKQLLDKKSFGAEIVNKTKKGNLLNIQTSVNPILNPKGNILGFLAIQNNITEKKKMESDLRESETFNRTLAESLPLCIKLFDGNGNLISINRHGREEHSLEGWTDAQIRKWKYLNCIVSKDRSMVRNSLRKAMKGETSSFVMRHTLDHAKGGYCFSSIVPMKLGGKIKYILFSSLDITESKEMETQLQKSHDELENRVKDRTSELAYKNTFLNLELENSNNGILIIDPKGKVLSANRRFAEQWGIPQALIQRGDDKKLLEFVLDQLMSPDDFVREVNRLYAHPYDITRASIELKDGRVFDRYTAPLKSTDGKLYGRLWSFRDMSPEAAIDRAKTEFVSLASHQLRTPLTAVKWLLEELLRKGDLNPDQLDKMKDIQSSTGRLIKLVSDLLNVSRLESGALTVEPVRTNVSHLMEDIVKEHRAVAKERGQRIDFSEPTKPLFLTVDPELFRQVTGNLISNAIKYSAEGKKVSVSLKSTQRQFSVRVEDQGVGMTKNETEQIFTKFYRTSESAKFSSTSSGLGLYIVKKILGLSGGFIAVSSQKGKGSVFTVSFPLSGMKAKSGPKRLV